MKPSALGALLADAGTRERRRRSARGVVLRHGRGGQHQAGDKCQDKMCAFSHGIHGDFNSQRCRSTAGLNVASVGLLLPIAESASGLFAFGTVFGITR